MRLQRCVQLSARYPADIVLYASIALVTHALLVPEPEAGKVPFFSQQFAPSRAIDCAMWVLNETARHRSVLFHCTAKFEYCEHACRQSAIVYIVMPTMSAMTAGLPAASVSAAVCPEPRSKAQIRLNLSPPRVVCVVSTSSAQSSRSVDTLLLG